MTCIPAEEIGFEIGHFRKFRTSVTLNLTLDWVTRHTVVYHSSTSTYTHRISLKSEKLLVDVHTDVRTGGRTDIKIGFIRSTWRSRPTCARFYISVNLHEQMNAVNASRMFSISGTITM